VAAGANPLIVITDPSDPEAVIVPSAAPLQDTFVALADTVTLITNRCTVVVAVQSPSAFPLAVVATTVYVPGP
jgi:hypothetical protein